MQKKERLLYFVIFQFNSLENTSYLHNEMKNCHGVLAFHTKRTRDGVERSTQVDGRNSLVFRGGHQHRHLLTNLRVQGLHRHSMINLQMFRKLRQKELHFRIESTRSETVYLSQFYSKFFRDFVWKFQINISKYQNLIQVKIFYSFIFGIRLLQSDSLILCEYLDEIFFYPRCFLISIQSITKITRVPCVGLHEDRHVFWIGGGTEHTYHLAVILHYMQHLASHCGITVGEEGHEQRNVVYQLDVRTYLVYASR